MSSSSFATSNTTKTTTAIVQFMRDLDDEISRYEVTLGYDIARYTLFGKSTMSLQSRTEKFATLRSHIKRETQAFADRINEFASKFKLDDDEEEVIKQNTHDEAYEEEEHPRIEPIKSTVEEFLVLQLVLVQRLVSMRKTALAKILIAEKGNNYPTPALATKEEVEIESSSYLHPTCPLQAL